MTTTLEREWNPSKRRGGGGGECESLQKFTKIIEKGINVGCSFMKLSEGLSDLKDEEMIVAWARA